MEKKDYDLLNKIYSELEAFKKFVAADKHDDELLARITFLIEQLESNGKQQTKRLQWIERFFSDSPKHHELQLDIDRDKMLIKRVRSMLDLVKGRIEQSEEVIKASKRSITRLIDTLLKSESLDVELRKDIQLWRDEFPE